MLVPVIILMVVAIGVGTALLTIVDTQTQQSGKQRKVDSAQTLAEGAVSATANVLAVDNSPSMWPVAGGCATVTGDLTNASAQPSTSLAAKITTEVQARFTGTSPDYGATAARNTTWRVDVCPVQGSESRWEETILTRTTPAPASSPALVSLWVRGQASVSGSTAATSPENARAVVSKVRQSAASFAPPENFAVGTGVFSTDVSTTLNTALTSNTSLVGSIAGTALGTSPVIAASTSNIGVRCGLLTMLDSPGTTCLAGSLAGVAGVTNATGLGTLNTILGTDRTKALGTWSMAPSDAIEQWRKEAQSSGVYSPESTPVPGFGNDETKNVSGGSGSGFDCFLGSPTSSQVVFIEKVGNGDQYCNVPAGTTAKILVVERGAVRIQGTFTGVVYVLNEQECGSDGTCTEEEREDAVTREVVRIDGNNGKVIGSVWADGAGGAVGIYPALSPSSVSSSALLAVGSAATGVCGLPAAGAALTSLDTAISGITGLVGNTLSPLTGVEEQVRYPGGGSAPTGCSLLQGTLGGLPSSDLLDQFGVGDTYSVITSEHRTRTCKRNVLNLCILGQWNGWSEWTTRDTSTVALPALLTGASAADISELGGLVGSTLTSYTAIQYDAATVANAAAAITQGAAPVVGTYRNVASIQ
ncbi:MAG TPA: hypothetical protein VNA28_09685 [Solirubrobacteraceae bacterium]|nr:hypothetical protein [Solirubrobacteraceae bacterium]